ncbi:MAG: isochorismatase family cysteine hydrolase [Lachnospiraceae bacterium]|nr:isochorismatase family cysteine hydrolase [Lachnospiraceae bacterium]
MKVLAVIDMQNDFIDGALGTKEAVQIKGRVKAKIDEYLAAGNTVIYTRDTHTENYLDTQEGKNLPVLHCVKGSFGWEIAEEVFVEGCPVIDKPSFGSMELAEYVAGLENVEAIELIGLCTDICVISNAMILKARLPEVPIAVAASCCAGVTAESHENALAAMKMCQIQII